MLHGAVESSLPERDDQPLTYAGLNGRCSPVAASFKVGHQAAPLHAGIHDRPAHRLSAVDDRRVGATAFLGASSHLGRGGFAAGFPVRALASACEARLHDRPTLRIPALFDESLHALGECGSGGETQRAKKRWKGATTYENVAHASPQV